MKWMLLLFWTNPTLHFTDHAMVVRGFHSQSECVAFAAKQDPRGEELTYVCEEDYQ